MMQKVLCLLVGLACCGSSVWGQLNQKVSVEWWRKNNLRVIQLNLPDYEAATLNADSVIEDLVKYSANTLIINAGGIMAFYDTDLDFHYRNPYAKTGTLEKIIKGCHLKNIKVMVRFDFSRIHESIFKKHPDWCYISSKGERIINTDMYVVSINGPYVQDRAFKIIAEVMEKFPIDGIFLNMPGYQTRNPYEGKYHGIDQNMYDSTAFAAFSNGRRLPVEEKKNDPDFILYEKFRQTTVDAWSKKLYEQVKAKNKAVAICTYSDKYVDIIRHESQTNALPYWPYSASDNVANAQGSYPEHIISNASIQQISFQSRFNAVEPAEVAIRLYENMANGSGLDMSMMGDMRQYEDERNFPVFEKIYGFHKKNEAFFGNYQSAARVLLVAPGSWPSGDPMQEYRGILMMLKEAHIQFDVMEEKELENQLPLKDTIYKLIILPDILFLSEAAKTGLKNALAKGVNLVATNSSGSDDPAFLLAVFGAVNNHPTRDGTGQYLSVSPAGMFPSLSKQTLVSWTYNLSETNFDKADTKLLPVLTKGRPGPPEITGGHQPTGYFAAAIKKHNAGSAQLMPANIGKLYYLNGYQEHKYIMLDLIKQLYPDVGNDLVTNAPARVELIHKKFNDHKGEILHLINLTGFSGNTYFDPIPVRDITIRLAVKKKPLNVFLLSNKKPLDFTWKNGFMSTTVPVLVAYESIVIDRTE